MSVTPAVHCRIKKSNKRYLTFSLEKIRRGTRDFSHECFYSFRAFLFMPRRTITNIIISPISSPNTRAFAFKAARNIIILAHNVLQDVVDDINALLIHRIDVLHFYRNRIIFCGINMLWFRLTRTSNDISRRCYVLINGIHTLKQIFHCSCIPLL